MAFTCMEIDKEIKDISQQPMTPESVSVLADLLYIRRHLWEDGGMAAHGSAEGPLTREQAMEWVSGMENADGTKGPHWTMEETEKTRIKSGISCEPLEFYVAMNMIYSDYVKAAEKTGASSMDFYVCMAKAFLEDKDAQPNKLARYYRYIVSH